MTSLQRVKIKQEGEGRAKKSLKYQTRAESKAWNLLSAVGVTGVLVVHINITTANAGLKSDL